MENNKISFTQQDNQDHTDVNKPKTISNKDLAAKIYPAPNKEEDLGGKYLNSKSENVKQDNNDKDSYPGIYEDIKAFFVLFFKIILISILLSPIIYAIVMGLMWYMFRDFGTR